MFVIKKYVNLCDTFIKKNQKSVLYIFPGFIKCMKYVTNPSTQYKYVVFIFKIKILSA